MTGQSGSRSYSKFCGRAILRLTLIAPAGAWCGAERSVLRVPQAVAAEMPQDEFEQRVRTYLLEHPEVIADAINRLQERQAPPDTPPETAALKPQAASGFCAPDSPVGATPQARGTRRQFFND